MDRRRLLPKAKNVVLCYLSGGLSQVDAFDPKPMLTRMAGSRPAPYLWWLARPLAFMPSIIGGTYPLLFTCLAVQRLEKPNLILLLTGDMGHADLKAFGDSEVPTLHLARVETACAQWS